MIFCSNWVKEGSIRKLLSYLIKIVRRRFMIKKRGKRPSKHLTGRRFQIQKKREIKKTLCRQPA